jgi:Domain of unknown function (DUF6371)
MGQFKLSKRRNLKGYCPCGKNNKDGKFVSYEGYTKHGYCHSCSKSFFPEDDTIVKPFEVKNKKERSLPISSYSLKLVEQTVLDTSISNFIQFFRTIFPDEKIIQAINTYLIGTWNRDKVIFWEIDQNGKVCHGTVMGYDSLTGKRSYLKSGAADISSMRVILKLWKEKDDRCLFGLHLTNQNTQYVALVESAKTAFVMSMLKPEFLWLATGGKGRFNYQILKAIKQYEIHAFPDKGEYSYWLQKAIELNRKGFNIVVHNLLEYLDYQKGTDLADICIDLKKKESSENWKPMNDSDFSEGSLEVFRMYQERKNQKIELTKEESYKAIQFFNDNNTDVYKVLC